MLWALWCIKVVCPHSVFEITGKTIPNGRNCDDEDSVAPAYYEFVEVLAVRGRQQNAVSYVCTRPPHYNVGDDMACTMQLVDGVDGATLVNSLWTCHSARV